MTVKSRSADFITIILITVGLGYLFYDTYSFSPSILKGYPGDAFFPRLILGFTLIWCAVLILRLFKERRAQAALGISDDSEPMVTVEWIPFAICIGFVIAFLFLLPVIGFELCTFFFMFGLLATRWHGEIKARLVKAAALSAFTSLFFYVTFVLLLNVSFPVKLFPAFITF
ncbi:MAG: tripartite tricarboxylate transporter TctB family protein [Rhodospirillales bacterium]